MVWPDIFRATASHLRSELPDDLQEFHWSAYSFQAKAWYGNKDLHYEIWPRRSLKTVELGLHFEADDLTNARLLSAFRSRGRTIARALGATVRIEEWDKGWARVWEPMAFDEPDLAARLPARFVDYVRVLEPILREELPSDVRWTLRAPREARTGSKPTSSRRSRSGRR